VRRRGALQEVKGSLSLNRPPDSLQTMWREPDLPQRLPLPADSQINAFAAIWRPPAAGGTRHRRLAGNSASPARLFNSWYRQAALNRRHARRIDVGADEPPARLGADSGDGRNAAERVDDQIAGIRAGEHNPADYRLGTLPADHDLADSGTFPGAGVKP